MAPLLGASATFLADAPEHPDPWYAANALYGDIHCLGVPAGQSLPPGREIHLIVPGQRPVSRKVLGVIALDEARAIIEAKKFDGLRKDPGLWLMMRCAWWFRGADAGMVATLEGPEDADFVPALGLRELPSAAIVVGGQAAELPAADLHALHEGLRGLMPKACEGGEPLLAGRRFGPVDGFALIEFTIGVPVYNPEGSDPPIRSIRICRFFLKNGGLKAVDRQSRDSGEEERVDTEPPALTRENWSRTQDETMAYVSRDGGCRWERIHSNSGFEGINYVVQSLEEGLPEIYHEYYYTAH